METIDSATLAEWVELEHERALDETRRARLEQALAADPELAAEHRRLTALHRLIDDGRIEVRPDFVERVMAALPAAWWERRRARGALPAWALPLAATLVLALGAALLLADAASWGPLAGAGATLLAFGQTTFLAGAGLLFATWTGLGFGLEKAIADSGGNLLALAAIVAVVDLVFLYLLRRPRPRSETAAEPPAR